MTLDSRLKEIKEKSKKTGNLNSIKIEGEPDLIGFYLESHANVNMLIEMVEYLMDKSLIKNIIAEDLDKILEKYK